MKINTKRNMKKNKKPKYNKLKVNKRNKMRWKALNGRRVPKPKRK